jgi:nitrogen fixation protein NifU and related proteins
MKLDELYQEVILDHYKHPRCQGCLSQPDSSCALFNPLCGDQIDLCVNINSERLCEIGFCGHGCSISQASASMMSDLCKGKSIEDLEKLTNLFKALMRGQKSADDAQELGDAVALEGVRKFSARIKCAMLAWEALEKCVAQLKTKKPSPFRVLE